MAYMSGLYSRLTPQQQGYIGARRANTPVMLADFDGGIKTGSAASSTWDNYLNDEEARLDRMNQSHAAHNRLVRLGQIATVAPFAVAGGAALAGGLGAGGASPAAAAAGPATGIGGTAGGAAGTAATAGKLATLGKLFSSKGAELGINAGLSLLQMRSQNKATEQARLDTLAAQREALALQRQQIEMEMRNADLDREDARALNAALNEIKRRELEASEEERAFNRNLVEQRETRLQPYRDVSAAALGKLKSMWGI